MRELPLLDNLRVAALCPAEWDKMRGDDRVRHCSLCELNVYNFSAMTRGEVIALLREKEGARLCGRMYRRADGTLLTKDCPVGLRARAKRVARRASVALAAILGLSVNLFGQQKCATQEPKITPKIHRQALTGDDAQARALLRLKVVDPNGAVVPGLQFALFKGDSKNPERILQTDAEGKIVIDKLTDEIYRIESAGGWGYKPYQLNDIQIKAEELELEIQVEINVSMAFSGIMTSNISVRELEEIESSATGKRKIRKPLLDKLPSSAGRIFGLPDSPPED